MIIIALGSNLGARQINLKEAALKLEENQIKILQASALYETEPVGFTDQPSFLNSVIEVETELKPLDLLHTCLKIEDDMGRIRVKKWGPRLIDIDLICYHQIQLNSRELILPHPYFSQRRFVMEPLLEIAEDLAITPTYTVKELYAQLTDPSEVKRLSHSWL